MLRPKCTFCVSLFLSWKVKSISRAMKTYANNYNDWDYLCLFMMSNKTGATQYNYECETEVMHDKSKA
jgi:hypothetical protein